MTPRRESLGFTLIELLLAMTIMALVMGAVFASMQVGVDAYQRGQQSMEVYQSARVGMRKVADELQYALSSNAFWKPNDQYMLVPPEVLMMQNPGMIVQENDPGAIRFLGQANEVMYVRKKYQLGSNPPFDLQECRIAVDDANDVLYLEVIRSLLEVKRASWYFQALFQTSLDGIVSYTGGQGIRFRKIGTNEEPPLAAFIGNAGQVNKRIPLVEGVHQITFRYTDGEGWMSSWNSQDILQDFKISPQSPNFNANRDMIIQEKGPPLVCEITLELVNGDSISSSVELPAGNMRGSKGRMGVDRGPAALAVKPQAPSNPNTGQPGQPGQPGQSNGSGVTLPFPTALPGNETGFANP
ncbi:MAG: prepilin-type N-terminal cleavage/methylation domain-containing protein [bacterium]|nr:prepilin-type N-terminal cleavage/methylation domain-containing protein [bacterium]